MVTRHPRTHLSTYLMKIHTLLLIAVLAAFYVVCAEDTEPAAENPVAEEKGSDKDEGVPFNEMADMKDLIEQFKNMFGADEFKAMFDTDPEVDNEEL